MTENTEMEKNIIMESSDTPQGNVYTSPQRKLVKFFEKSRNKWKARCLNAQATLRQVKNRASWLEQSRDNWKARARQLADRVRELETETGQSPPAFPPKKRPIP